MSASWYEVLGVSRDASTEQIRDAWRDAIADFDPTDRRFGLYNDAAKVLLDPGARDTYDRTLPAEAAEEPAAELVEDPTAGEELADDDLADLDEDDADEDEDGAAEIEADEDEDSSDDLEDLDPTSPPPPPPPGLLDEDAQAGPRAVPAWLLIALALATVVCAGVAGYFQFASEESDETEDAVAAARAVAAESFGDVLTYRWDDLEAGRERAAAVLTPAYYDSQFASIWAIVQANAKELKAVVTTEVLATGVVRASDDGKRVELVAVLRNEVSNSGGDQGTGIIMVGLTMVDKGGSWLVDDIAGIGSDDAAEDAGPTESATPTE